jgi:hypothetical protein
MSPKLLGWDVPVNAAFATLIYTSSELQLTGADGASVPIAPVVEWVPDPASDVRKILAAGMPKPCQLRQLVALRVTGPIAKPEGMKASLLRALGGRGAQEERTAKSQRGSGEAQGTRVSVGGRVYYNSLSDHEALADALDALGALGPKPPS